VLTYDEQRKYLAKACPILLDVATLMLETGMPEEVYRIRPESVNLAENYVFNPYGKTKAAKRRIKLTATAKSILTLRIKAAAERAAKGPRERGIPLSLRNGRYAATSLAFRAPTHGLCAKAKWLRFAPMIVALLGLPAPSKRVLTS